MKYFLLFLLSFSANAQSPWYYGSGEAVNLENGIKYKNGVKNITGALDPSATAVNAPAGSLYESTNGSLYVKQNAGSTTDWAIQLDNTDITKTPYTFAGFDLNGKLYSTPTYTFIPYQNGLASSMTTDGSSQTNIEKLFFGTTFGDGVSGDIDNYTDLYFSNITNANFNLDYYRSFASYFTGANGVSVGSVSLVDTGFGGNVINDFKGYNTYFSGDNNGSSYGFVYTKDGISGGDSSGVSLSTTGQAVNIYGYRNNIGGIATGGIEQVSLFNSASSGNNYFGVNDNQQGNVTNGISHFNGSNQGNASSYTGVNTSNSGVMSSYITGYNFYNQNTASSPALTFLNGGNDANISGNITGLNFNNNGSSVNHTEIGMSNGVSGSAVTYQGLSINNQAPISSSTTLSNLTNSGDGVQTIGESINITGNHTTSITGLQIDVQSATHPNTVQPVGASINGALNVSSTLTTGLDPVGMASSLNSIGGQFHVASGAALSGGEFVFGNNLAPVAVFNDSMGEDATGLDLGFSAVAYVGSIGIDAGKTVADMNMALAGVGNPSGSGVVDNMTMYYAAGILPQGGSVTANNMYGFKTSTVLCGVATDCWGLNVQDTTAQNYVDRLAISTLDKKVSSSDVGLELYKKAIALGKDTTAELNAMTATEGAIAYNSTTQKPSFYNGTIWQDIGAGTIAVTDVNGTVNQIIASATTGSITLSLPQDIATGSAVEFTSAKLNGLAVSTPVKTDATGTLSTSAINLASADVTGLLSQASGGLGSVTPGAINNVLKSNGTNWVSGAVVGSGGITGPASTSTGAIVLWNTTDGTAIKQLNTGNHRDVVGVSGSAIEMVPMPRLYGSLTITAATDCIWQTTQTTATSSFAADSDCSNSFVYKGGLSTTGSQIPKAMMLNAPVGNYYVVVEGGLIVGAVGNGYGVSLREISGVEFALKKMDNGTTLTQTMHMTGILTVHNQGDTAIDVRMWTEGGTLSLRNNTPGSEELKIMVFYYPPL